MVPLNSNNFKEVYQALGIDTRELGCFMVDTDPIVVSDLIAEDDLYYADPAEAKYVQGIVSEDVPHVTVLYGLMRSAKELEWHITQMMEGLEFSTVRIEKIGFFHSTMPGLNYKVLIAELELTPELVEANGRVAMLPHLNTFVGYKPHITLAYVKDTSNYQSYVKTLNDRLAGSELNVTGFNFG